MPEIKYPHIDLTRDTPYIEGTQTKVLEIVRDKIAWGWDADEVHRQFPDLGLAQIHAAFTYYYDHKEEIDAEIDRRDKYAEEMKVKLGSAVLRLSREELLDRLRMRQA